MIVGAGAAKHQVRVTVDQARSHPAAAKCDHLLRAKAGQFGALADAQDLAVGDGDGTIFDDAETSTFERRDIAVDE